MIVYGIKNCDTVKKARRWLDAHAVIYQFHDLRTDGFDRQTIENWLHSVDWQTLLNKRGTTWRRLEDPRKETLDKRTAVDLMLDNPTLIKRPVVCDTDGCHVGFNEQEYLNRYGH
ncbi:MAG: ArsC family reductase [Methylophaga sp.]|nr:ArsC family reductase [Methylophaga sp.]